MSRKLIIIGNGLGMALSPDEFSLKQVMPKVWREKLDPSEQDLIASCISGIKDSGPSEESQLMNAQIAQLGHELITGQVDNQKLNLWFTENGRDYPQAIGKYVYEVARQLDSNSQKQQDNAKLKEFLDSLVRHIFAQKSHVATLNYDTLLYSAFNDWFKPQGFSHQIRLCFNYEGALVDGHWRQGGFAPSHFERKHGNNFGFYLHLHGSPLFVGSPGRKLGRHEMQTHTPSDAKHIILSDGSMKPHLIERSEILKLFWDQLSVAINEACEIILFGYGGGDAHLNEMLGRSKKRIRVVERQGTKRLYERQQFWKDTLNFEANLVVDLRYSVLDFKAWDETPGHSREDDYIPF